MTIDEAIKILTRDLKGNVWAVDSPLEAAIKLGIEALKEVKTARQNPAAGVLLQLPGETEK